MAWALFKPKNKTEEEYKKHLEVIKKEKDDLIKETQKLDQSLVKVHRANQGLKVISKHVKDMDFSKQTALINSLELDEDYKKNLVTKLNQTKEQTQKTLEPLIKDAAKLQGNMIVAKEKASQMILIIDSQRRLVESGKVQAESIKKLQTDGMKNMEEIRKLVHESEEINSMAKHTVMDIKSNKDSIDLLTQSNGGADEWDSILEDFNPARES